MNILLVGSGGREHALAWKISQSPKVDKLFIAPGNAGTATVGINVPMSATDFPKIKEFVLANQVAMVVVGPEDPLVKGIYDYFKNDAELASVPVIGPSKVGAQLEGSKDFAKAFMMRHHIPTLVIRVFVPKIWKRVILFWNPCRLRMYLRPTDWLPVKGYLLFPTWLQPKRNLRICWPVCLAMQARP